MKFQHLTASHPSLHDKTGHEKIQSWGIVPEILTGMSPGIHDQTSSRPEASQLLTLDYPLSDYERVGDLPPHLRHARDGSERQHTTRLSILVHGHRAMGNE